MKLRENAEYDLITLTSMGVRITPANCQPAHVSTLYEMQATSAESNVLNISASLGLHTMAMTKFVKDSSIARFIKGEMRKRNIQCIGAEIPQGGPWGFRHQFNIADSGYGGRGPQVQNDRAGEVGCTLMAADFDLERIFAKSGCKILHLSGLIGAMSPETSACCLEVARFAKTHGTTISFDLNYRASFWANREKELRNVFRKIAALSDILIGNEEDFQLALGIEGPAAGGNEIAEKTEGFKDMIERMKRTYPNAKVFSTTLREVESANAHYWGAILLAGNEWQTVAPRPIQVVDRIGGGDGYVGGMLYGILRGWPCEKWIQFGWATGALAATMLTDYATPVDEDQVWSIYEGNARVKR